VRVTPAPRPREATTDGCTCARSNVDKVDATMDEVRNQLELTNEISQAISDPAGMGIDVRPSTAAPPRYRTVLTLAPLLQVDDQELADELAELEQEELNKRLAGAEAAPLHAPSAAVPAGACSRSSRRPTTRAREADPAPSLRAAASKTPAQRIEEDEEEAELRELQAQLAM